jgi:TPP-dependent pyruvate/acetoin dehydrogenase alpha subunit
MIEAITYRIGPHSSSDDPTKYRDRKEVDEWMKREPIKRMKGYLIRKGYWDEEKEKGLIEDIDKEIRSAVKVAETTEKPPVESIFENVYEEMPWHIKQQMDETIARYGKNYRGR